MPGTKILICDDQAVIHDTLGQYIQAEGFDFVSAYDGKQALELFHSEHPDLVVLDIMMPELSGTDVCREIRRQSMIPIIMLTARGEEIDRILGLELGADDYIVKPFSPREVVARMKAVLRRLSVQSKEQEQNALTFPGLAIDLGRYEVQIIDKPIPFTPKEVEVLFLLGAHPGQVFDREQILAKIWGYSYYGDTQVVDTQIKRIRHKLAQEECPYTIKSIYGVGYKFEVPGA